MIFSLIAQKNLAFIRLTTNMFPTAAQATFKLCTLAQSDEIAAAYDLWSSWKINKSPQQPCLFNSGAPLKRKRNEIS